MVSELLVTKLYLPRLHADLLPRPQLLCKMNKALERKLTLVCAPAGFGKTTAVAAWVHEVERAAAWLSLDEDDNAPRRFLSYLAAALGRVGACSADARQAIESSESIAVKPLITKLINDILSVDENITLVLDDYHQIEHPEVHAALETLITYQPPQLHLVLVTRVDPPLPLARLRAQGVLTEIRVDDLRFSREEVAAFLKETMALGDLTGEELETLEAQTEGWPAGLQLAALSIERQENRPAFIQSLAGTNRYILDYLMDEVFSQQKEEIQHFLLRSSVLKRMNAGLCDAVVYEDVTANESQRILEQLEQANLFVLPLDDHRGWYRYHHLFGELLQYRLKRAAPDEIPALHLRASQWYECQQILQQAIDHARAAGDDKRVADMIEQHGHTLFGEGALSDVVAWLGQLPPGLLSSRPGLCMIYGWALTATGQGMHVERWLRMVEQNAGVTVDEMLSKSPPPALSGPLVEIAALRAVLAVDEGDFQKAIQLGHWALEQLDLAQGFLFHQREHLRPVLSFNQGRAEKALGRLGAAQEAFSKAAEAAQSHNLHIVSLALGHLGNLQALQADLGAAADTYRRALAWVEARTGSDTPFTAINHAGLGNVLYEWNDLEGAHYHLQRAVALAEPVGHWDSLIVATIGLAQLYRAQGRLDTALETLSAFDDLRRTFEIEESVSQVEAIRAWLVLHVNGAGAVGEWLEKAKVGSEKPQQSVKGVEAVIYGCILLAQDEMDEVLSLTARLIEKAERTEQWQTLIRLLLLRTRALAGRGEEQQAYRVFKRALGLARPGGYIRSFLDEGGALAPFLYRAITEGIMPEYAGRALAAFPAEEPVKWDSKQQADDAPLVEPLSEREVEVLDLIAEGLTNREIGQQLSIALGTVKTHTYNIYGKLGVNSRTQAVTRAQSLDILSTP